MELPTTVTARAIDAPYVLPLADPPAQTAAGPPRAGRLAGEAAMSSAMSSCCPAHDAPTCGDIGDQASEAKG
jgi:hypothetical protein